MQEKIFIGTSGYSYSHWGKGVFYPEGLSRKKWFEYYTKFFNTVEINASFYRLFKREIFEKWHRQTPKDFIFTIKGNRFITHIKKIQNCKDSLKLFFESVFGLKEKLRIVLWQLPPGLVFNAKKLRDFCEMLAGYSIGHGDVRQAFEFRHQSWFSREVYQILKEHKFSLCIAHSGRWPYQEEITSDLIYLRFHGGGELYNSNYSISELERIAFKIKKWLKQGKNVHAYFNNDAHGFAVKNSFKLKEFIINSSKKKV
ncbi:DUF72 domain-containing protein [bacterium]|nr:DUF72 domain-containing protein [bacterium]